MKTGKIIKKNIKLLTRSRTSTLVLILGPLLVIVLVGMSFSTSTFNLNIGVYSDEYSEMSSSFVDKLINESYTITRQPSEELCRIGVEDGQTHACIVFPPNMDVQNDDANIIKFYVDPSQINLVYLVISTLERSFGEKSSEISTGLTSEIVTTLFDTKTELTGSESLISSIVAKNSDLSKGSEDSISSLDELDFQTDELDVQDEVDRIKNRLDELRDDSSILIDDGLELVEDLEDYSSQVNDSSGYLNELDDVTQMLEELNDTISSGHNSTATDLNNFLEDLSEEFGDIADKLDKAGETNEKVIKQLETMQETTEDLKQKSEQLDRKMKDIIENINSIQVTNTENIVSPFKTEINQVVTSESNLGFLFPSLVVMLIMFIGLLLPSTLIIMEKNSRAYFRVFTTPTKPWLFVLATYLTSIMLILFQLIIILGVSQIYFKINFLSSLFTLLISLAVIMTTFILLGMLIGYIFSTEEMSMLASISIGTLFLLTSGIIFPMESMPQYILEKARFNPVVLGSELFRKSVLLGSNFNALKMPLFYLVIFSAALTLLILLIKKMDRFQLVLKRPSRQRIKKDWLAKQFVFGERTAKTLPEFVVSIQNMSDEKFHTLLKQNTVKDWLSHIYKNRYLADKVSEAKTKQGVLDVLIEELKRLSDKK